MPIFLMRGWIIIFPFYNWQHHKITQIANFDLSVKCLQLTEIKLGIRNSFRFSHMVCSFSFFCNEEKNCMCISGPWKYFVSNVSCRLFTLQGTKSEKCHWYLKQKNAISSPWVLVFERISFCGNLVSVRTWTNLKRTMLSEQVSLTLLNPHHITLDYLLKSQLCLVPLENEFALMFMKLKRMCVLLFS